MFHLETTATSINIIKSASEAKLAVLYKKVLSKFKMCNNHLWFNTMCLKKKLVPKYIQVKCKSNSTSAQRAVQAAEVLWIKYEIKKWYNKRKNLNTHLYLIHTELLNKLHPILFHIMDTHVREEVGSVVQKQYIKQKQKLQKLIESKSINSSDIWNEELQLQFYPRVKNLSSSTLEPAEERFLEQGLNFAPMDPPSKHELLALAMDTGFALQEDPADVKWKCHQILKRTLSKPNLKSKNSLVHKIKKKLVNNNLILSKADKGNTITILDQKDYIKKVHDFITDSKATVINKDPTGKFQKILRTALKTNNSFIDYPFKYVNSNPSAPVLFGLPKLHKENTPIRPVVSFTNAPTYLLCQTLNKIIPNFLQFRPAYSVKNSLDLINKISDLEVPTNAKLVSFDVNSLFTSVPVPELLSIIEDMLKINNKPTVEKEHLLSLIKICLSQNYFCFDNKFYMQDQGLPMGSPLSPLMAEIYMNFFEINFLKDNSEYVSFWYRYVDDILCLWEGTERQLQVFFKKINQQNNFIRFSMECENNKNLNFLDLNISHNDNTKKFKFDIYRKSTYTDTVIPAHSNHPKSIKMAAFQNLTHRLVSIPLSKANFKKEYLTIKRIALNNGYDPEIVDKILKKKQRTLLQKQIYNISPIHVPIYRKLQYIGAPSTRIAQALKRNNLKAAYYNSNSLKKLVNNKIISKNPLKNSGIYKINCNNCDSFYIGQTRRNFEVRYNEHIKAWKNNKKDSSNLAKHLIEKNHTCDRNNLQILHVESNYHKLNFLEGYEIQRAVQSKSNLINEQIELFDPSFLKLLTNNLN